MIHGIEDTRGLIKPDKAWEYREHSYNAMITKEKKIRYISLDHDRKEMVINTYNFGFNARFICNYLSKAVRPLKLIGDGNYTMITVDITPNETKASYSLVSDDVIDIKLNLSADEQLAYNSMSNLEDRYEFYLSCLERGYRFAEDEFKVPVKELLQIHQQFRDGGYKNEWIWIKKPLKDYGIYVVFRCKFTTFDFTLNMEVYDLKKTRLITEGLVFRTGPDELFFYKDFKKIDIKNDTLYVLNFLSRPVFSFDLNKLRDGIYNIDYLGDVAKENKNDNDLIKRITW